MNNIKILRELSECLYNISGKTFINDSDSDATGLYKKCNKLAIIAQEKMWTLLINELDKNEIIEVLPDLKIIK